VVIAWTSLTGQCGDDLIKETEERVNAPVSTTVVETEIESRAGASVEQIIEEGILEELL